ncbi:MAG: hypothetical protein RLZ12_251 [Bacillota bacterium]|jgi:hypothetical protein
MLNTTYSTTNPATAITLYHNDQLIPILYGTISLAFTESSDIDNFNELTINIGDAHYLLDLRNSTVYTIPLNYTGPITLTYTVPPTPVNFTIDTILSAVYAVDQTKNCTLKNGCCA